MIKACLSGFLVPILIGLFILPANGQRKANFSSLEFGAGPSLVGIYDNSSLTRRYAKLSATAGMGLVYAVKRDVMVTAHLMYERKGGIEKQAPSGIESFEKELNTTSSYISFSPGIRRYLGRSSVFVEGGPWIAFLFHSRTIQNEQTEIGIPFTTLDMGASGSVGVTPRRRELKGWNFRLVNNLGLADVNHDTGTKEWTNALSLIAGIRIRQR